MKPKQISIKAGQLLKKIISSKFRNVELKQLELAEPYINFMKPKQALEKLMDIIGKQQKQKLLKFIPNMVI